MKAVFNILRNCFRHFSPDECIKKIWYICPMEYHCTLLTVWIICETHGLTDSHAEEVRENRKTQKRKQISDVFLYFNQPPFLSALIYKEFNHGYPAPTLPLSIHS